MKVVELRAALQERNLPTGGKKKELAARLQAALDEAAEEAARKERKRQRKEKKEKKRAKKARKALEKAAAKAADDKDFEEAIEEADEEDEPAVGAEYFFDAVEDAPKQTPQNKNLAKKVVKGKVTVNLGVPSCRGAFTPSTRVVSRNDGRGWFLFRFWGHSDTAMLRAGPGGDGPDSGGREFDGQHGLGFEKPRRRCRAPPAPHQSRVGAVDVRERLRGRRRRRRRVAPARRQGALRQRLEHDGHENDGDHRHVPRDEEVRPQAERGGQLRTASSPLASLRKHTLLTNLGTGVGHGHVLR